MRSYIDLNRHLPKQVIPSYKHRLPSAILNMKKNNKTSGNTSNAIYGRAHFADNTLSGNILEDLLTPACIIFETKGKVILHTYNKKYSELHNQLTGELTGKEISTILNSTERKEFLNAIFKAKSKKSSEYIYRNQSVSNVSYLCKINRITEDKNGSFFACIYTDISSLTLYIDEIKKEKNLRNTYLDIAGVIIIVLDKTGKIKFINKKGCEILGYPLQDIIGRNWFNNFLPDKDSEKIRQRFRKLVSGKEPEEFYENEITTKERGIRLINWHTSNLYDENGQCIGIVSSGEDITEKKRMENDLTLQSLNADFMYRLSRIIANTPNISEMIFRSSELLAAYPGIITGCISVYDKGKPNGFAETRRIGKRIKALEYIFEREKAGFVKVLQSGAYEDLSELTYSIYGIKHNVKSFSIGLFSQKDPLGLLNIISSKITPFSLKLFEHAAVELSRGIKKKRIELKQMQTEKNFSAIFNTAPDCMVITDIESSVILEVNSGFTDMTGFKREEVLGKSVFEINSWANPKDRLRLTALLKKNKKVSGFNTKLIKANGSMFDALFSAAFIDFDEKKCMLTIAKDISERVKIEKENLRTKELLERITESTPAFISLYDVKKDQILFSNKSLLNQLGYTKEKIEKIHTLNPAERYSFYHEEDVAAVKAIDKKVLELNQGEIMKVDYRIKSAAGEFRWFQHTITIFQKKTKQTPLLTINVFEDITERKTADDLFRKNKEEIEFLYQAGNILSSTLDLFQIYDRMHTIVQQIAKVNELIVTSYDDNTKLIHYKYLRSTETDHRIDVSNIPPIPLAPEGFGIVSKVIRSGKSMLFNNYSDSFTKAKTKYVINEKGNLTESQTSENKPKSAMFIPILLKKKILGVAQFYSFHKNAFNEDQVRLIELMMKQVALATHNARLYEDAQAEISFRKATEEEFKRSKENVVKLAESVPDVIYRYNFKTGKYDFISPVIIKLLGYPLETIIEDPCSFFKKVIHPDDWINVENSIKTSSLEGPSEIPVNLEYRVYKRNGEMIWVRDIKKIEWAEGKPAASIGAISDITIARRSEEERRQRDEQTINNQSALLELSRLKNTDFEDSIRSINEISAKSLNINRVSAWLFNKTGDLETSDVYTLNDGKHDRGHVLLKNVHEAFFNMLYTENKYINKYGGNEEFMKEFNKEWLTPYRTSLILISRVRLHGEVVGILVFESLNKDKKEWTPDEYDFSVAAAGFVTLALESQEHIEAEIKIKRSLNDKELLLREIHHRVKNNLQVISSLLYLQSRKSSDPMVIDALLESQRRVKSMVLIHEKLYRSEDLSNIDYKHYITALTNSLFRSYRLDMSRISLRTEIDKIMLSTDSAIQCGLIINELVSNAIKHAFPDERSGEIVISLINAEDNTMTLTVSDNGIGLPKDYKLENSDTLGMQLVNTLVGQMNGTLNILNSKGSTFIINFKVNK